jgi:hypothetical protein
MADHVLALLRKKKKREELARVQERLQGPDVNPGLRELRSQEQTLTRQKQLGAARSRRTSAPSIGSVALPNPRSNISLIVATRTASLSAPVASRISSLTRVGASCRQISFNSRVMMFGVPFLTSMALTCRWRSRPQHQNRTSVWHRLRPLADIQLNAYAPVSEQGCAARPSFPRARSSVTVPIPSGHRCYARI